MDGEFRKKGQKGVNPQAIPAIFMMAFVFGIVAYFLIPFSIPKFLLAWNSKSWPTTQGKITSSEITKKFSASRDHKQEIWEWKINYLYTIEENEYTSDRVYLTVGGGGPEMATNLVEKRFPVGKEVTVYYDPEKPDFSLLIVRV